MMSELEHVCCCFYGETLRNTDRYTSIHCFVDSSLICWGGGKLQSALIETHSSLITLLKTEQSHLLFSIIFFHHLCCSDALEHIFTNSTCIFYDGNMGASVRRCRRAPLTQAISGLGSGVEQITQAFDNTGQGVQISRLWCSVFIDVSKACKTVDAYQGCF